MREPATRTTRVIASDALTFVKVHGVVLVSGKGAVPRLTDAVAGEPIRGSWWGHPKSHQIFAVLQAIAESDDILFCRLVDGKITLVHRRLWPALVRVAEQFSPDRLAQVRQEHTPSGKHANKDVRFPHWVPPEVVAQAKRLGEQEALAALGPWAQAYAPNQSTHTANNAAPYKRGPVERVHPPTRR